MDNLGELKTTWVRTDLSKYSKLGKKAEIYTKIDPSQRITPITHSLGYPHRGMGYEKLDHCIPKGVKYIPTTRNERGSARMCGSSISLYPRFCQLWFYLTRHPNDVIIQVILHISLEHRRHRVHKYIAVCLGETVNKEYSDTIPDRGSTKHRQALLLPVAVSNWVVIKVTKFRGTLSANDQCCNHSSKRRGAHFLFFVFWWVSLFYPSRWDAQCITYQLSWIPKWIGPRHRIYS